MTINICAYCPKRASRGIGGRPTWLCAEHYAIRLARVRALVQIAHGQPVAVDDDGILDVDEVDPTDIPGVEDEAA